MAVGLGGVLVPGRHPEDTRSTRSLPPTHRTPATSPVVPAPPGTRPDRRGTPSPPQPDPAYLPTRGHHRTQPTRTTSHQHPPGKHQPTPTTGPTTATRPTPTTGPTAAGRGGTGQPGRPQPPTPNRHLRLTTTHHRRHHTSIHNPNHIN